MERRALLLAGFLICFLTASGCVSHRVIVRDCHDLHRDYKDCKLIMDAE